MGNEADDKIVAVLEGDAVFGGYGDVGEVPSSLVDRLRHYFLTYKQGPDRGPRAVEITHVYGRDEAYEVIRRSLDDYRAHRDVLLRAADAALEGRTPRS